MIVLELTIYFVLELFVLPVLSLKKCVAMCSVISTDAIVILNTSATCKRQKDRTGYINDSQLVNHFASQPTISTRNLIYIYCPYLGPSLQDCQILQLYFITSMLALRLQGPSSTIPPPILFNIFIFLENIWTNSPQPLYWTKNT
jgi:hypothetical protein